MEEYAGAQISASIDSVSLESGRFIGEDTQAFFARLVAEQAAKKSFFNDVAGFQSAGLSQPQIEEALSKRKAAADIAKSKTTSPADLNLAAMTESGLCTLALMRLQDFGMASLFEWAAKENAVVQSKPTLHR